jgi:hypothetical protein
MITRGSRQNVAPSSFILAAAECVANPQLSEGCTSMIEKAMIE